jgi:hypothetical protein
LDKLAQTVQEKGSHRHGQDAKNFIDTHCLRRKTTMTLIALLLSLFVAAFGALGVLSPARLLGILRWFENLTGLIVAAAFRIALGLTLFSSAHASNFPETIRILGIAILIAGIVTPFVGVERLRKIVAWLSSRGLLYLRIWAGITLGFGLFLSFAVVT